MSSYEMPYTRTPQSRPPNWTAAVFVLFGYLLLVPFPAHKIGLPLWSALGLFALPALIGLAMGRTYPKNAGPLAASGFAAGTVFLFVVINLAVVRARVVSGAGADAGMLICLVSLFYAAVAGGVAAAANLLLQKRAAAREGNEA